MIKLPEPNGLNPEFYHHYCLFFVVYHYSRDEIIKALNGLEIEPNYLESIKKQDVKFLADCLLSLMLSKFLETKK